MNNTDDNPVPLQEESDDDGRKWDGSEAEFVESGEASEFSEKHAGIKLKYTLTEGELHSFFSNSDDCKKIKKRIIIKSIVYFLFGFFFIFEAVLLKHKAMMLLSLPFVFIGLLTISKKKDRLKDFVGNANTHDKTLVEVYPSSIVIKEGENQWEIELDGSADFEEQDNLIIVRPKNKKALIIPIRCIEPDFVADVQAMILAGTLPKDEE